MTTHWFRIVEILYQNDLLTKKMHQEYHQLDTTNQYFHSQCAYYKIAMTIINWLHIVYSWPTMNFYSKHPKHIVGMKSQFNYEKNVLENSNKNAFLREKKRCNREKLFFSPVHSAFAFLRSLELTLLGGGYF